jgi:hypothetical protein
MILWGCHHRLMSLLIGDIVISLTLLWTLFYEQQSDKILLKIKFYLHYKAEEEEIENRREVSRREQFVIITSSQSLVFIMQVILAGLPFIASLLSYKHKGIEEKKQFLWK